MRKRGEGSIWREGDSFVAAVYDVPGTNHRRKVKAKTEAEIVQRLADLHREIAGERQVRHRERKRVVTLGEWLDKWLSELTVDQRTEDSYRARLRHVTPALRRLPLTHLGRGDIRAFCSWLRTPVNSGGKGLHQTTAHDIGTALRIALGVAVDDGLLTTNPAAGRGTIPPAKAKPMEYWTREEMTRFLTSAAGDAYEDLFYIALETGARQGELFALRWRDIEVELRRIVVLTSISRVKGRRRKDPKSDRGKRSVDTAVSVIRRLVERRDGLRCKGNDVRDDDLVFPNGSGRPLAAGTVKDHMDQIIARARIKRIRFNDLRHTHATLSLQDGDPVPEVAARLGHDPAVLLGVYAHVIPRSRPREGFLDRMKVPPREGM